MQTIRKPIITKSDFMLFMEAPRHLWAKKHGRYAMELSDFDQHLIRQGYEVESLARQYFFQVMPGIDYEMKWQQTYIDGSFEVRTDALLYKPASNSYDLYEIKSRTVLDKEDIYDVTFQALVLESQIKVDRYYVLHLNKGYTRSNELELAQLFVAEDITDKVEAFKSDVMTYRDQALQVTLADNPETMEHCYTPKVCPCPDVCHPDLPEFSIYDIPYLRKPAKQTLLAMGIQSAKDVPGDFFLNEKQRLVVEMAKTNQEQINPEAIREQLDTFTYPIYFLDYETCICAIPPYKGYHPQQQVVFQYSLHRLDKPDGELHHFEHLSINPGDPAPPLLERLRQDIGDIRYRDCLE